MNEVAEVIDAIPPLLKIRAIDISEELLFDLGAKDASLVLAFACLLVTKKLLKEQQSKKKRK